MHYGSPKMTIINADFTVGPVLTPARLRILKTLGFASVVSAASDAELAEAGRRPGEIKLAVEAADLRYRELPADHETAAAHLAELAETLPKPVYVFAGNKEDAAQIWAVAMTGTLEDTVIRQALARAGRLPAKPRPSGLAA